MSHANFIRMLSILPCVVSCIILLLVDIIGDELPWPFHWFAFFFGYGHFIMVMILFVLFSGPLIFLNWNNHKADHPHRRLPKIVWFFPLSCVAAFALVAVFSLQLGHAIFELTPGVAVVLYSAQATAIFIGRKSTSAGKVGDLDIRP